MARPPRLCLPVKRTRLRICRAKRRFASDAEARAAATDATLDLRPYRCDRCRAHHLPSRRKGKRVPRPVDAGLIGAG